MIEQYGFGKIIIKGKTYKSDIIIFGDIVQENWWRNKGHELCVSDIQTTIKKFNPTVLVVGTGKFGMVKILPETISYLESLQIQLITQKTQQACKTYNQILNSELTMGAFHLTC